MTDQPMKRDVLIHYDEEKDEIAFYTLDVAATARARANSFDGARLPLAELRKQGPDEAERTVGSGVFSMLDAFSIRKAGIRDYDSFSNEEHRAYVEHLEALAEGGDADAQYHLAIELLRQARESGDAETVREADRLFHAALKSGLDKAVKTADTWPRMLASLKGPAA